MSTSSTTTHPSKQNEWTVGFTFRAPEPLSEGEAWVVTQDILSELRSYGIHRYWLVQDASQET